jgi:hypothetical protein
MNDVLPIALIASLFGLLWLWIVATQLKAMQSRRARAALLVGLPLRRARGELPDGDAIVVGPVQPTGATLRSPLHDVECVYFSFSVRERQTQTIHRHGKTKRKVVWVSRVADTGVAGAVVGEDGVAVDVRFGGGPRVDIKVDTRRTTGFLNGPDDRLQATLERYKVATTGLVFNKDLRIEERVLEPGDAVTLVGSFKTDPSGRTRMMPLRGAAADDDERFWLITDRKPEAVIATARREATAATVALVAWFLSFPLALVGVAVLRAWWPTG